MLGAMRTGKLAISRGHEIGIRQAPVGEVRPVSFVPAEDPGPLTMIHARLNALERLTRLVEQGAISLDEFKLEKSLILRLTGEELLLTQAAAPKPAEPSPPLLTRLLGWRALLVVTALGTGLYFGFQPEQVNAWVATASTWFAG